ncbi:MAG: PD40 domain-containing protein [Bacteroides sp.]|nr:PD40 domain-containing protein [Bacteroides sp.]
MKKILYTMTSLLLLTACTHTVTSPAKVDAWPEIFPDYVGVTIPSIIAPMNFDITGGAYERVDVVVTGAKAGELHVNDEAVLFPLTEWQELLEANVGDSIRFTVSVKREGTWKQYRPFSMFVSPYPVEYGVVYRKIAPGYEVYSKMGIYERDLSTFEERALFENTLVPGMCLNCHTFNKTNPDYLSLHIRGQHGATLMQVNGKSEWLNTKADSTLSACVYPYWHPDGEYIAYSVNSTRQVFHVADTKRIEVFDLASDLLVYHPQTHELLLSPLLQQEEAFETFPAFSPDGRTLYFCSANAKNIPDFKEVRYNLCRISFDAETGTFGNQVDTLVNAASMQKSISFPRPSYDGKYLMFTLSDYGNFSIWHKEADLWLLNLEDGSIRPISEVNSDDTDSFHNWSANSRWFVFSSRRGNGLYTRLYLACMDEQGNISKPFLLPQEHPWEYYESLLYSYNVPDFTSRPILQDARKAERKIVSDKRVQVKVRE